MNHYHPVYQSLHCGAKDGIMCTNPKDIDCPVCKENEKKIISKNFNLISHLERQIKFSLTTFGPGPRTQGIIDHITKELKEIEKEPHDLMEWIDLILLAFDGAWRAGFYPAEIVGGLDAKLTINERRMWPDWRTADEGKAIEHIRQPDEIVKQVQDKNRGRGYGGASNAQGRQVAIDEQQHKTQSLTVS